MYSVFKRSIAFLVDTSIVSLIAWGLYSTPLNPYKEEIEENNERYEETLNYYASVINEVEDIYKGETLDLDKISNFYESYPRYEENLKEICVDDEFTKVEHDDFVSLVQAEFQTEYEEYYYKEKKLTVYRDIISLIVVVLYFVVFNYYMKGQTIGKKILKLKIVPVSPDEKLSIWNYLLRALILNGIIITLIDIIGFILVPKSAYFNFYSYLYVISYALEIAIIAFICFRSDHRGLHDLIARTKVISFIEDEVKEAKFVEKKEVN